MSEIQKNNTDARVEARNALLAALSKVKGAEIHISTTPDEPEVAGSEYYVLNRDELAALLSGNMEKIEKWVGSLDRRHATWLLKWLIKENT
jgi:hypothetical protein